MTEFRSFARHWTLEPGTAYLNHGAYGACPRPVLEHQAAVRREMERAPTAFFERELYPRLDAARERLARFVGAQPDGLAFLTNPTGGVNTVLRALDLRPGDRILVTDHAYNACKNALDETAGRAGCAVDVVALPFPLQSADEVLERVMGAVRPSTRIALLDHVTSATGLVMPIARLVSELAGRGVDSLVDGAHAPGMVSVDLDALGAAWYAGHCHKWLCAPKGAAFLHVREDCRESMRPLVISHGLNRRRPGRSLFHDLFDWSGTHDPSPYLCVPAAIDFVRGLLPGGWPEVMRRNHALALAGRDLLLDALGIDAPCPEEMLGSLASLPLPGYGGGAEAESRDRALALRRRLREAHRIEVPITVWGPDRRLVLRISAQLYNALPEYRRLAAALPEVLEDPDRAGPFGRR